MSDRTNQLLAQLRDALERLERAATWTDSLGRTWHTLGRTAGVCLYFTLPGNAGHFVVWDSLDQEQQPAQQEVQP